MLVQLLLPFTSSLPPLHLERRQPSSCCSNEFRNAFAVLLAVYSASSRRASRAATRPPAAERRPTVTTIPSFFWRKRWSGLRCGCRSWSPEPFLHNFLCTSRWYVCIDVYRSVITLITYPPFCSSLATTCPSVTRHGRRPRFIRVCSRL